MGILESGYFSDEANNSSDFIKKSYDKYFSEYESINELAHSILNRSYTLIGDSPEKLVIITLYSRILTSYQSIYHLYERGYYAEPRIILRSLIELVFYLSASINDPKVIKILQLKDENQKLKSLNRIIHSNTNLKAFQDKKKLESIKEDIEERKKIFEVTDMGIESISKIAKMHDFYITVYSILCLTAHHNLTDLETHIEIQDGLIMGLSYGPTDPKLEFNLATSMEVILLAMEAMEDYFHLKVKSELELKHDIIKNYLSRKGSDS